jgi:hypothetical protein
MMLEFISMSVIGIMTLLFVALGIDFLAFLLTEKPRKNVRRRR